MVTVAAIRRRRFEWLTSFLKRRWVLLSCVVVLFACSFVDLFTYVLDYSENQWSSFFCVVNGYVILIRGDISLVTAALDVDVQFPDSYYFFLADSPVLEIHEPRFGSVAQLTIKNPLTKAVIPLWLPLAAVLGWVVIRELRWREKKARTAEQSLNPQQPTLN